MNQEAIAMKERQLSENNKEIKLLQAQREKIMKEVNKLTSEIDKLKRKIDDVEEAKKDAIVKIMNLKAKHTWIEKEEKYFGASGSNYDFSGKDMSQLQVDEEHLAKEQVPCTVSYTI